MSPVRSLSVAGQGAFCPRSLPISSPFPLSYTKRVVFVYEWGSEGGSYTKRVVFVYGNGEALEFSRQKRGSPGHFAPNSSRALPPHSLSRGPFFVNSLQHLPIPVSAARSFPSCPAPPPFRFALVRCRSSVIPSPVRRRTVPGPQSFRRRSEDFASPVRTFLWDRGRFSASGAFWRRRSRHISRTGDATPADLRRAAGQNPATFSSAGGGKTANFC